MDFRDLYKKIATIDSTQTLKEDGHSKVDECGPMPGMAGMPSGMPGMSQPQQDQVSMNVSMNAQGKGGIRDLMNVLRDIEDSVGHKAELPHDGEIEIDGPSNPIELDVEPVDGHGEHDGETDMAIIDEPAEEESLPADTHAVSPEKKIKAAVAATSSESDLAEKFANEPNVQHQTTDYMTKTMSGGLGKIQTQHSKGYRHGDNPLAMKEGLKDQLWAHYNSLKEARDFSQGTASGMPMSAPQPSGIDPVRNNPVNALPQNVAPQANRPGLAPKGDPKLWDIQMALQKKGFKIKADGLNGPATEKAAKEAGFIHDARQDIANPNAASWGQDIGHAIGSATGWIETAWRNIKQGFSQGQQGMEESAELNDIKKLSGLTSEAYNPNSTSAQHRRMLDKHEHDRLKSAAEKEGATDADKARYKRYQDKKAATRAAYDAEMER